MDSFQILYNEFMHGKVEVLRGGKFRLGFGWAYTRKVVRIDVILWSCIHTSELYNYTGRTAEVQQRFFLVLVFLGTIAKDKRCNVPHVRQSSSNSACGEIVRTKQISAVYARLTQGMRLLSLKRR